MEIYVVQYGDDIQSIANKYGITVERLISDNGLINPYSLVVGQSIIILYPKSTYTVKQGDTLAIIADNNGISEMQLIRNNPFLYDREYIYPDETLVIAYNTMRDIQANGYTSAFVSQDILTRALPYLTFLSIYNYHIDDDYSITSLQDDSNIIRMSKVYDTIPLLMISLLSQTGEINIEFVYEFLLDNVMQDNIINDILQIIKSKEFLGINLLISYISDYNQGLYLNVFTKLSKLLRNEGYLFMVTISPDFSIHENLDYHSISLLVDRIFFLENIWTKNKQPPAPISNVSLIRPFIENVTTKVSPDLISIGIPLIGFDWTIPFIPGTAASLMALNTTITVAYDQNAVIQLDEVSQTPYYNYTRYTVGALEKHQVWFIDARTTKALADVITEYDLIGTGLWNITSYNQQLFSLMNSIFNIIKLPTQ
ncbi:MAG: Peptidoglycan-binding lysin domain protein [Herbinix sp.]|jgi:spore germination protein|nr:Peptidoglycan-binding lysin domain protein [Herbinix sp.]